MTDHQIGTKKRPHRNHHMMLTPIDRSGAVVIWRCNYCGQQGPCDDLMASQCTYVYSKCEHCGGCEESNECKPDCPGILALLGFEDEEMA